MSGSEPGCAFNAKAFNLRRNKRMVAIRSFGGAECSPRDCHGFFIFENGH
jgi:hypothetical protein